MKQVPLQEMAHAMARVIADVEAGEEIVLTRDGIPVVRVVPIIRPVERDAEWQEAYDAMVAMMKEGLPLGDLTLPTRDELYER